MIPHDLHYNFPTAAYLLLMVFLFVTLYGRLFSFRQWIWKIFAPSSVLKMILIPRATDYFWIKVIAFCTTWVLAVLAFMQPEGNGHYPSTIEETETKEKEKKLRKAHDVIFLVDASASMEIKDTRTGVSRFESAKEMVDEIVSRLKGENAALYAFTSETSKLSPLTMDYLFLRLMLRQMQINEGGVAGTNLMEALGKMRDAYFSVITPKQKTLIILTDGGDTEIEGLTGKERQKHIDALLHLIGDADMHHLRVFTIGLGSKQGGQVPGILFKGEPVYSRLDEELLKSLALQGRGEYYAGNDWTAMDLATDLIENMQAKKPPLTPWRANMAAGGKDLIYDLFYQIPLGLALFFLAIVLFFPDTKRRKQKS